MLKVIKIKFNLILKWKKFEMEESGGQIGLFLIENVKRN
jgi:hypothetical protein